MLTGSIIQINTSHGGLPKTPVAFATVTRRGIEGDVCAHPQIHGGPNQALLLIGIEAIEEIHAMGYPVYPGALGENFTTRGLDRKQMRLGQRYRAGDIILELTKMRAPCNALDIYGPGIQRAIFEKAVKIGDYTSPLWGLAGCYASVIEGGEVYPDAIITLLDQVV
jgi:MOSC domain-containing protein YiiM